MTTVKEFKDLGVKFVEGDERSSSVKGHGDVHMSADMVCGTNNESKTDHESIVSFAWRPLNTLPDNPKFKYEIDIDNHSWRPMLDQPKKSAYDVDAHVSGEKIKPEFTQAMADAGELPPVGSECRFLWTNLTECSGSNQDRTLKVIAYNEDNTIVWGKMNGNKESNLYRLDSLTLKPLDNRTPKQKAVDEMIKSLETFENEFVQLNKYEAGKLYDAGYRKC